MRDGLLRGIAAVALFALVACAHASQTAGQGSPSPLSSSALSPSPSQPDPIAGTWQTARVTEAVFIKGWEAAGGTARDGQAFWKGTFRDPLAGSLVGVGAKTPTSYVVLELKIQSGSVIQFEGNDGATLQDSYEGTYHVSGDTVQFSDTHFTCTDVYRFTVSGSQLQLHLTSASGCGFGATDPPAGAIFSSAVFTKTT